MIKSYQSNIKVIFSLLQKLFFSFYEWRPIYLINSFHEIYYFFRDSDVQI